MNLKWTPNCLTFSLSYPTPHYFNIGSFKLNNLITDDIYFGQRCFRVGLPCGHCNSCWALELHLSTCCYFTCFTQMFFLQYTTHITSNMQLSKMVLNCKNKNKNNNNNNNNSKAKVVQNGPNFTHIVKNCPKRLKNVANGSTNFKII